VACFSRFESLFLLVLPFAPAAAASGVHPLLLLHHNVLIFMPRAIIYILKAFASLHSFH
jgi:hypothetical protein